MSAWKSFVEQQRQRYLDEVLEFLRIPSVSSVPEHAEDVRQAAVWLGRRMKTAGIDAVEVLETDGHPVVYGEHLHADDRPTILIYGHFDTQPVEPLDAWDQPPFDPVIQDDRILARGASDDKGPLLLPVFAIESILQTAGELPLNVKFLFEGEEEIGSPSIAAFLDEHRERLACDLVVCADGVQWDAHQPAIFLGFKGITCLQIDVTGPTVDLHSGIFGGAVQNPIHALTRLLDSMRDSDGTIRVDGFYDAVRPLSKTEREQMAAVPFDEAAYRARLGVNALHGEPGYSTYERVWARPTLEIVGVWGGNQGGGIRAIVPASAHARLICRLVVDQTPEAVLELIRDHVDRHTPPGVKASVRPLSSQARPYLMPSGHPGNRAAQTVLKAVYGRDAYAVRLGGTLPICALFVDKLDAYTVMFAFGLDDELIHAPNEFWRLSNFDYGVEAYGLLLHELAVHRTTLRPSDAGR